MKKYFIGFILLFLIASVIPVWAGAVEEVGDRNFTGNVEFTRKNTATATLTDGLTLKQETTGTPAAGIGVGIAIQVEDAGGVESQGKVEFIATTVTDSAEDFDFVVKQNDNGTLSETLRIVADNDGTTEGTRIEFTSTSAETDGVNDLIVLKASGGTTVAGFGVGIDMQAEFADGVETACKMEAVWTDVSTNSEDADFVITCKDAGAAVELARFDSDGAFLLEGATADGIQLKISAEPTSADKTATFPDATGTVGIVTNGAAPAATCVVGEMFFDTDETDDTNCTTTADNRLCICYATNTWGTTE